MSTVMQPVGEPRVFAKYCKTGALLGAGVGVGATLMYFLDPARGRARRHELVDCVQSACGHSSKLMKGIGQDLANRALGVALETKSAFLGQPAPDEILIERVRARLGHVSSHPHAIEVTVKDGHVTLRGPVLTRELEYVLHELARVPGVSRLENHLEVHDTSTDVPLLQGGPPGRAAARN